MYRPPEYERAEIVRSMAPIHAAHEIWNYRYTWRQSRDQLFTEAVHAPLAYALLLLQNELPEGMTDSDGRLPSFDNKYWFWHSDEESPSVPAWVLMEKAKNSTKIARLLDACAQFDDENLIGKTIARIFNSRS